MSFDLTRIRAAKRAYRRSLAALPVAKKLAMLDALRDRMRAIRLAGERHAAAEVRESPEGREPPPDSGQ